MLLEIFSRSTWTPGQARGDGGEGGDMDPGSVIPVPDRVRDDGSGTGVTGC
jgi:hypothetical protein